MAFLANFKMDNEPIKVNVDHIVWVQEIAVGAGEKNSVLYLSTGNSLTVDQDSAAVQLACSGGKG
jgi:hypothetical protein